MAQDVRRYRGRVRVEGTPPPALWPVPPPREQGRFYGGCGRQSAVPTGGRVRDEAPLIRPFGPPSPEGEGLRGGAAQGVRRYRRRVRDEAPLIRPCGPPSPEGEGLRGCAAQGAVPTGRREILPSSPEFPPFSSWSRRREGRRGSPGRRRPRWRHRCRGDSGCSWRRSPAWGC